MSRIPDNDPTDALVDRDMAKDTVIKILTLFQQIVNEDESPYTFAKLLVELGVLKISAIISQLSFSTPS